MSKPRFTICENNRDAISRFINVVIFLLAVEIVWYSACYVVIFNRPTIICKTLAKI